MEYIVRQARTRDVPEIRALIDQNVGSRRLLEKHTVNLYEDILEFSVSESSVGGDVVGCGALHVLWEDLAELRTVAVDESRRGEGIGHLIVDDLLDRARRVGVSRVFVLTFAVSFFGRHGFSEINGTPVAPEVYAELLRSYDDGVAEFLDLDRVKPNTLGNTRMLLRLLEIRRYPPVSGAMPWPVGPAAPGCCSIRRERRVECLVRAVHQSGQVAADARAGRGRPLLTMGRGSVMLQDLAALTPPAIVCVAVLIGTWAIVRRELAPKRRERAQAEVASDEDRAVDPEHGRSLYFPTSAIYLAAAIGYAVLRVGTSLRLAAEVRAVRLRRWQRARQMTTYAWAICQLCTHCHLT